MDTVLEVSNIKKTYKDFVALNGISFLLKRGEILGFLGPNGAGKTTTIQILLQIITPDSGNVTLFGKDAHEHREYVLQRMNFTSAYVHLFGALTVWENLKVFAKLYGVKGYERIHSLLKEFEADDLKDKKAVTLSSGQLTRVMVVKALLNNPELLLLDEPTSSLDPDIAHKMRGILKEVHRSRGVSMLYTSHNMVEIEEMCNRVIFISRGEIVANDSPQKLTELVPNHTLKLYFEQPYPDAKALLMKYDHTVLSENNESYCVNTHGDKVSEILQDVYDHGFKIKDLSIVEPHLEDVFLKIAHDAQTKKQA